MNNIFSIRNVVIAVSIGVIAGATLRVAGVGRTERSPETTGNADKTGTTGSFVKGARAPVVDVQGNRYIYQVDTRHSLVNRSAGAHATELVVSGQLAHTAVDDQAREFELVLRPRTVRLNIAGTDRLDQRNRGLLLRELASPVLISVGGRGHVDAVHLRAGLSSMAARTLKSLVANLQFVRPKSSSTDDWNSEETSASGRLRARYQRRGVRRFTKTTQSYTSVAHDGGKRLSKARITVESSAADIALAPSMRISSVNRQETLRLSIMTGGMSVRHTEITSLRLDRVENVAVTALAQRLDGYVTTTLDRFVAGKADPRAFERQLLGNATLPQLMARLKSASDSHARNRILVKLRALFRLQPDMLARAASQLAAMKPSAGLTLLGAMGSAGTEQAQITLRGVAHDAGLPVKFQANAVAHLGRVQSPQPDTVTALEGLLDSAAAHLRNTASLALGTAASRLAAEHPERATAIIEVLRQRIAATTDTAQLVRLIVALGNVGSPAVLPDLARAVGHPDPKLRHAAAVALQAVAGAEATALLQTLSADSVSFVARTATQVLQRRARS